MSKVYGQTLLDDMVHSQGLPLPLVKRAANEILDLIREGLARDGVVNISHFGTFRLKAVAERQGINPQTRQPMTIPAHQRVFFSPCKALRELIQPEHPAVVPIPAEQGSSRTAARSAPIAPAAPIASKQITPETITSDEPAVANEPPPAEPPVDGGTTSFTELSETQITSVHTATQPVEETRQGKTEAAVSAPVESDFEKPHEQLPSVEEAPFTIKDDEATLTGTMELESEFRPKTETEQKSSRKGYYLGGAALLVLAVVMASLLLREGDEQVEVPAQTTAESIEAPAAPAAVATTAPTTPKVETSAQQVEPEQAPAEPMAATPTPPAEQPPAAAAEEAMSAPSPATAEETVAAELASVKAKTVTAQVQAFFFSEQPYTMKNGESLWRLARRFYQAPLLWPHIYQANAAIIINPDNLLTGQQIVIPTLQGKPDQLTRTDRRNIAEGYYLTYLHYKKVGHKDAFFALLEAKRYDNKVVEEHRSLGHIRLSKVEEILLGQQETMPF